MAKYTIMLHDLIASGYDIGLDDYPIFDSAYRTVLNKLITDHFFFREIGMETPAVFKHYLNITMNENMPYFNKLYQSGLLALDPLNDFKMDETSTRTLDGTSTGAATSAAAGSNEITATNTDTQTQDNLAVESGTPAGLLAIADIKTNAYASSAKREDNTATANGSSTSVNAGTNATESANTSAVESTDAYIKAVVGRTGRKSPGELLVDYRKTLINVDRLVLDSLETCFMGVY